MMMCGGSSPAQPVNQEIKDICQKIKSQLELKCGQKFSELTPTLYKTQFVAGINYFVKAHTGGGHYVHIRIFKSLPHEGEKLEVNGYQTGKSESDTLEYF